jgi:Mor family transcriptional regulator|tara:strand:+ start:89 stop:586 length:498 start_codon:yes stop_codon:yes gene_type:complete
MISINNILSRLDILFYIIVFAIIYVVIIYLWKKIAQLESSFYKLETTFATQLLNKEKDVNSNKLAEDILSQVFDNKDEKIEIIEEPEPDVEPDVNIEELIPDTITEITEVSDVVSKSSVDETTLSKSKLSKMSVEQLKEYCGNLGYQVDGTKADLINRILNNQRS